jgi:hypothetical protein
VGQDVKGAFDEVGTGLRSGARDTRPDGLSVVKRVRLSNVARMETFSSSYTLYSFSSNTNTYNTLSNPFN